MPSSVKIALTALGEHFLRRGNQQKQRSTVNTCYLM
jgi:hypothetical protein